MTATPELPLDEARALTLVYELARGRTDTRFGDFARGRLRATPVLAGLLRYLDPEGFVYLGQRATALQESALDQCADLWAGRAELGPALVEAAKTRDALAAQHDRSLDALDSPGHTADGLPLLTTEEAAQAAEFCRRLVQAFCYVSCLFFGPTAARPYGYLRLGDLQSAFAEVNMYLEKVFLGESHRSCAGAWAISTAPAPARFGTQAQGFVLRPLTEPVARFAAQRGLARLAPGLFGDGPTSGVVCAGEGYIVGADLDQALNLTSLAIHSDLPVDAFGQAELHPGRPRDIIARAFGDTAYCVTPDAYVLALNRHQQVREWLQGSRGRRCLICGQPSAGRRLCPRH
jgi:hypothetical protein